MNTDDRRPVITYLLAASHSGSTLLALLLASHPDACTVGELKATSLGDPEIYRCACGTPIRSCPFWTGVSRAMAARGQPFDIARADTHIIANASPYVQRLLRPLVRGRRLEALRDAALTLSPAWHRRLARFHAANEALASSVCELTGSRVIVDSSKVGIRLKYLLRNPALDVRVVRLIRDGRAVALTYTDPSRFADAAAPHLRGGGDGSSRDAERLTITDAAHEWRRSNEEADALIASIDPSCCATVTYEALCRDPQAVLEKLWTFIGLAPVPLPAGWRQRNRHVVGNGMRFDVTEDVRLDERWKTALDADAQAAFEAEAGPVNRRLGYV